MTEIYNRVVSGELQGSADGTTPTQMPDVPCRLVWFKAEAANATNVYIGGPAVTVVDGTTDLLSGIQLDAGNLIGPIPISNLNLLWYVTDATGDDLTYLAVG